MKIIVYLLVLISILSCDSNNEKIKPKLSTITESVYASVAVRPEITYFPNTIHSGRIQKIYIKEGDTVVKGQLLFEIELPNKENHLNTVILDYEQAESNYLGKESLLNNIMLETEIQKERLTQDSMNFIRQKKLWSQNIGAKVDLENAKIAYEASQNKFQSLQQTYTQTLQNLKNSYQKAQNNLKMEQQAMGEFIVQSKINGTVYSLFKEEGDLITQQEKFAEIGSNDHFKIEMNIDEVDIIKINLGDTAIIILDAYPDKVFKAFITAISPKKDETTQTFTVESRFISLPPKLYYGLSGEANIIIETKMNALTIPPQYLLVNGKVVTEEGEKEVKVGMKNLEFVEILTGIDSSTLLLKVN